MSLPILDFWDQVIYSSISVIVLLQTSQSKFAGSDIDKDKILFKLTVIKYYSKTNEMCEVCKLYKGYLHPRKYAL